MSHKSVLLKEVIDGLEIKDGETIVDATLGNAGHVIGILETKISDLTIVGIDADATAILKSKENLEKFQNSHHIYFENKYFDSLEEVLSKNSIESVDKFIFDLGIRSDQIDQPERGFSFQKDGPLNMSFDQDQVTGNNNLTAEEIVNEWSEETLADIIYGFGEEKFSRRIARGIVKAREISPIKTTLQLAEIVKQSVPIFYRRGKINPATKTFQAIRIAVNSEIDRLQKTLPIAFEKLRIGGRIAVISFHSIEDRIVKRYFKELSKQNRAKLINKKPIIPNEEEITENPRSRSAKLRIVEKVEN